MLDISSTPASLFSLCLDYATTHFATISGDIPKLVKSGVATKIWENLVKQQQLDDNTLPCFFSDAYPLKELNLQNCNKISDTSISLLSKKFTTSLNVVNLSFCTGLTTDAYKILSSTCPSIHTLILNYTSLSDNALQLLASNLPGLKSLSIQGCNSITETSIQKVASRCTELTYLDISYCKSINSNCIKAIASLSSLTYLDISWCSDKEQSVSDSAIQKLAKRCTNFSS
eukprot:TRINITY_DN4693_c0_g1_i1.p1 TRINITY_DN4693_c0_g1~~TRINITY_DN4693_c0_g1_i1.p1  ORF type:complete len:229 (+),score=31.90 TRINITY_DN4693_c0_g1_i1:103-789(+)